jgi:thiol:disulfide interchange protein DsbD
VLGGKLDVQAGRLAVGEAKWPKDKPKTIDYGRGPIVNNVYTKRFAVYVPLTAPADLPPGEYEIAISPQGQICLDVCINLDGPNALATVTTVKVGPEAVANAEWADELVDGLKSALTAAELTALHKKTAATQPAPREPLAGAPATAAAGYTIWGGLGLALLAGLTLNIMPCVLPIIPLRIYSLVTMSHESRRRFVTLGLAFAGGIVLFFAGLAAVSVVFKLLGRGTIDLNEHFQIPWVRILIAMVLLALSANLWGLFNVTVPSKVASLEARERGEGHLPAVGMGLMMAVLSTPCSFWLMALALAWAQIQPLWLGTVAIVAIGVGMALPHAALVGAPGLVKKLPKPGKWMEYFKHAMGFLLVPAVLYLLSTLPERGGWPFRVAAFGAGMVFALWMWGSWVRYDAPPGRKLAVRGPAVVLVTLLGLWLLPQPAPPLIEFEPFDAVRIADARSNGELVVVKVTAKWCTECKLLEEYVFNTPEVAAEFHERNVVAVEADVTDRGRPAKRSVDRKFGGAPPLTIIYPRGGGDPTVLVGGFPKATLFEVFDKAMGS